MSQGRTVLALVAIFAGMNLAACGSVDPRSRPSTEETTKSNGETLKHSRETPAATTTSYLRSDGDHDTDEQRTGPKNDDQGGRMGVREGTNRAESQTIASVVKSYLATAANKDGTKGCSLLASPLATVLAEEGNQPQTGSSRACASSLSRLFKQQHAYLAAEDVSTMVVTGVHVHGSAGVVTLGFKASPESSILLQREDHTWKINALFNNTLP